MTRRIVRVQRDAQNDNNNGHLAPRCEPYKRPDRRGYCPHTARPAPVPRSRAFVSGSSVGLRDAFSSIVRHGPTRPSFQGTRNAVVRPHGSGHHYHVAAASPAGRPRVARRRARRNTQARLAPVLLLPGKPRVSVTVVTGVDVRGVHRHWKRRVIDVYDKPAGVRQDETFRSKRWRETNEKYPTRVLLDEICPRQLPNKYRSVVPDLLFYSPCKCSKNLTLPPLLN